MIKRFTVSALGILLGFAASAMPASAAAGPGSDTPPSAQEALRAFAADHQIAVDGLDRVGSEPVTLPSTAQSAPTVLHKLLENYGYVAVWPEGKDASTGGLPTRLVIIGPNGSGQGAGSQPSPSATQDAATDTPPASTVNQRLTTLALKSSTDPSVASAALPDGAAGAQPSVTAAPMSPGDMAALTQTAMQQVRALALALKSTPVPSDVGGIPPAVPAKHR